MKSNIYFFLFICLVGPLTACAAQLIANSKRPATWAQPIQLEGVPNLHKVSDDLYRSAQPTAQGMKNLEQMGIKTVVNLRSLHSDKDELAGSDLKSEHIAMKAWHTEQEDVVEFLKIVNDPERTPVLVHCQHGADRTGTICALYRITVQGWTKEEALKEMTEGGFGFHAVFQNLPSWIQELDIDAIKTEAGLKDDDSSSPSISQN
ncbi:dual specificity protein phosphatase family protein [Candidatus Sumerlaeota bacterium]|nr:dual specificity protein phosphatase family protein [Candidatus Sumerlaeota bacterium]